MLRFLTKSVYFWIAFKLEATLLEGSIHILALYEVQQPFSGYVKSIPYIPCSSIILENIKAARCQVETEKLCHLETNSRAFSVVCYRVLSFFSGSDVITAIVR